MLETGLRDCAMYDTGREAGFLVAGAGVGAGFSETEYVDRCDEVLGGRIPEDGPEMLDLNPALDEGGLGRAFLTGDGFTEAEDLVGEGSADL